MIKLKLKRFIRFYARGGLSHVSITGFIDIGYGNGEYSLRLDSLRKSVKPKLVLKSLDYKLNIREALSEKRKIRKYLSMLYIPAAKLSGRGDKLFAIFTKILLRAKTLL